MFPLKLMTGALALGLSACALGAAERVPSLLDPSNPAAAQSPVRAMLALHASPSQPVPSPKAEPPAPGHYVCPMHRDVTAHEPGRCPKCGMKLVLQEAGSAPKKEETSQREAREASSMQGGSP
ncbi:MAG: heavy metal-binding domain-containing protein [Cystobacter sp.]